MNTVEYKKREKVNPLPDKIYIAIAETLTLTLKQAVNKPINEFNNDVKV
ncbi:MAG: hypothetical protein ACOX14_05915 [Fermentimonas caenicola]|jgi:hypothetical protein|nr:hypothetical protein [Lascolabacillus sp.]MDD3658001.1 hypothetical protein [Lascolabacillus sp.]MDI9625642.1 hypothetical protein [Bacteroidota bacterium]